jgi:hypothetical protein
MDGEVQLPEFRESLAVLQLSLVENHSIWDLPDVEL